MKSKDNNSKIELPEIDINCDLGEGIGMDEAIMPYISSASIACGYHAGNEETIWQSIELAIKNNVSVGAHPSFLDKEHFGRIEMDLPPEEVYELVAQQLILFDEIASDAAVNMQHVKPHGALYNLSAKKSSIARAIAEAVKDHNKHLILFGLSGSQSIIEAKEIGLKTASEVFADRTYRDDGNLTARSTPNALLEDADEAVQQALQMIKEKTVTTLSGKTIPIVAETICIHGDGKKAIEFAMKINKALKENNFVIKAIS
ncbi:MAG: 5-oxoprolinase subunit PxpA [Chitinophagaceae bacterium]